MKENKTEKRWGSKGKYASCVQKKGKREEMNKKDVQ